MSYATSSQRWRRPLWLGAAILLLHWLALRALGTQVGTHQRPPEAPREMIVARLLAPEPELKPEPAPTPPPKRPHARPPRPRHAPVPPPPSAAPPVPSADTPPQPNAGEAPAIGGGEPGPDQAGAAVADAVVESVQGEPDARPAAPPAPVSRVYKVDMPPSADLALDVARVDADGTRWSGEALLSSKVDGTNYQIKLEAGIRVVFARVNLLVLTSEGGVSDSGFAPLTMTEKRRGRALTATHFNRQEGTITFSASQNSYPLAAGAQDKASVPLQLAAIARADPGQLSKGVDILVAEDRDATVFHFVLVGQEQIETRLGSLQTWHLSRPPKPGSYNSQLDIWLSPAHGWLPVQIRNLEASGALTTQTVNNIVMTDTGK